jgi:hypothetical protein
MLSFQIRSARCKAVVILITGVLSALTSNLNGQGNLTKPFLSPHSADPPAAQFSRVASEMQSEDAAIRSQRDQRWRGIAPIPLEDPGTNGESGAANTAETFIDVVGPAPEALPIKTSEIVAIGHVTSAQGFVTPDKSGVYSEFSITVERVLKAKGTVGQTVIGIRMGGQVHFPSGHVTEYLFYGVGYPKIGPSYLFFLHQQPNSRDFGILTAYELSGTKTYAIDNVAPFIEFDGADQVTLLKAVDTRITHDGGVPSPIEGERAP